jgi:hypothetical protein
LIYATTYDLNSGTNLKSINLNLTNKISKGVYFIELETGIERITKKIIVQ